MTKSNHKDRVTEAKRTERLINRIKSVYRKSKDKNIRKILQTAMSDLSRANHDI